MHRPALDSHPRWFAGNEQMTRDNPEVVSENGVIGIAGKRLRRYVRGIRRIPHAVKESCELPVRLGLHR